jgi:hypothetical protein
MKAVELATSQKGSWRNIAVTLIDQMKNGRSRFEGARLEAAPYIVFKDVRHG